jgi:hypothetical protein
MTDFMRGASQPRAEIHAALLEAELGAPPGPVLVELLRLACRLAPFEPWAAFQPLRLELMGPWVSDETVRCPWTPDAVRPFALADDCNHVGFFDLGDGAPLDRRPVCVVADGECAVVAPDRVTFLGLVAIAGLWPLESDPERAMSDESWLAFRMEQTEEDEDGSFLAASSALCSLPGVRMPSSPTSVVRDAARRFPRIEPEAEPSGSGLDRVRDLVRLGRRERARAELVRQVDICLGIQDIVRRERWREIHELVALLDPPLNDEARAKLARVDRKWS